MTSGRGAADAAEAVPAAEGAEAPPPVPVNVVLVGCGAVARLYYAPALRELERIRALSLKAAFDPDDRNAGELLQRFPEASRLDDLARCAGSGLDLAIVASPPSLHAEQTLQLLRSGLAVLCEKPLATTVADAEAMIEAAAEARRPLAVGLHRRFFPAAQTIRQILREGALGEVTGFRFMEGHHFSWPARSPSLLTRGLAGGGVLMDLGVHALDLLVWWLGDPDEVDYEDDAMGGIEATCRVACRYRRGCAGEVRLSRDWPLSNRYVIECTGGWLAWNVHEASELEIGVRSAAHSLAGPLSPREGRPAGLSPGGPGRTFEECFIEQVRNVAAAVRGAAPPAVPGEEALPALRLIERCYRGRRLLAMPWLAEEERTGARRLGGEGGGC